ncbi:hypothetical protein [Nostoc sp.]|uniref:hypothetical protein n=1 Tax=Nostoc sp. TaxID=1180 RepID=UPI002FF6C460
MPNLVFTIPPFRGDIQKKPDTFSHKGVIVLDQLYSLDWDTRKCKPVYQFPFEMTKVLLYRINEIISSSLL